MGKIYSFIPMWMLVLSTFLLDISLTFQTSSGTCRLVDFLNPFQASWEGTWRRYHSIYRPSANVPGNKLPRWKSQIVGVSHISTYHIDTFSVPIFEQRNSSLRIPLHYVSPRQDYFFTSLLKIRGYQKSGHQRSPSKSQSLVSDGWYPLVNVLHSYGKIHHFVWEKSLFLWPFSIAILT